MSKVKLLASSPSIEGITACINRYWCSRRYVVENGKIYNTETQKQPQGFVVIKRGERYRFEYHPELVVSFNLPKGIAP